MFHRPSKECIDVRTMLGHEALVELDLFTQALLGREGREVACEREPKGFADAIEAFSKERLLVAEMPEDGRTRNLGAFGDGGTRFVESIFATTD